MSAERSTGKKRIGFLLGLLLIGTIGLWIGDRMLKQQKHPGLTTFISQLYHNYPKSFKVEPKLLSIKVGQAELDRLQAVVDAARERGVIIPEGNEYVSAELETDGKTFKAKIRIKGKMTDHVKGDKWSFRVIAKKDGGFLGMGRFSLQHPGTRNYLYEWLHQQLAKGEGLVALRYGFIQVEFNGEDLGIYAYEEHFSPDLLENNDRVEGPLFRFDPGLFWIHRLNEMNKLRFNESFAPYQAAAIDAYGTGDLAKDPVQRKNFEEAVALMNEFRQGRLPASAVFDPDKIARRLALLDLLGGHRSLDWSDAKFYYDPIMKRIEPIAYESFSAFSITDIAGAGQWAGKQEPAQDIHTAWFNDPLLFKAYIHHLERFSDPNYLDSALTHLALAIDTASATIYGEFPYKELTTTVYAHNQKVIKAILDVPIGFHAYRGNSDHDTVSITAVPVVSLPIQVHGLRKNDGTEIAVSGNSIVPIRTKNAPGIPITIRFASTDSTVFEDQTKIIYSVLGSSVKKEMSILPFRFLDGFNTTRERSTPAAPLSSFSCLSLDENTRSIVFRKGTYIITNDLIIPTGYTVIAIAPLTLDLQNGAKIICSSPMLLKGMEDAAITFRSSDKSGGSILLQNNTQKSTWEYVRLEGFGNNNQGAPAVQIQMTELELTKCVLAESPERDLMLAVRSTLRLTECEMLGAKDQLRSAYSTVRLVGCDLNAPSDDAIVMRGGELRMNDTRLNAVGGTGLKANVSSSLILDGIKIAPKVKGIEIGEATSLKATSVTVSSGEVGIEINGEEMRYGPSQVELVKVDVTGAKQGLTIGKGNVVHNDGILLERDK